MTPEAPSAGEDWPPRLTIDQARILDLLTGDRFYSSKDAALREVGLNAIDACFRRAASEQAVPRIDLVFDDETLTITVADNGDGMKAEDVSGLFTRLGASISRMAGAVENVGEFGIGVISYFLVCDEFEVQTLKAGNPGIGLIFKSNMLDGVTAAEVVGATRSAPGTTVALKVRDQGTYEMLLNRFPHWFRGVEGLVARRLPADTAIPEGTSVRPEAQVQLEAPAWAESVHLGPPATFDRWTSVDGRANIDVLYRGVFVQTQSVNGLWGMEGSVFVHPKQLKPKLNREGFLAEDLQSQVVPFLHSVHPQVLEVGLSRFFTELAEHERDFWTVHRLIAMWLAIPRTGPYGQLVASADAWFRQQKFFRLLTRTTEQDVSLDDLRELTAPFYLAPDNLGNATDIIRSATRVLRARGESVIQGQARDTGFLGFATFLGQSTADLLLMHFGSELGDVQRIETIAEQIVAGAVRVAELFSTSPKVALVKLGEDSAPLVQAAGELWINLDTPSGRQIVKTVCNENRGRMSLLLACHEFAAQAVTLTTSFWRSSDAAGDRLGLMSRQRLRELVS